MVNLVRYVVYNLTVVLVTVPMKRGAFNLLLCMCECAY